MQTRLKLQCILQSSVEGICITTKFTISSLPMKTLRGHHLAPKRSVGGVSLASCPCEYTQIKPRDPWGMVRMEERNKSRLPWWMERIKLKLPSKSARANSFPFPVNHTTGFFCSQTPFTEHILQDEHIFHFTWRSTCSEARHPNTTGVRECFKPKI